MSACTGPSLIWAFRARGPIVCFYWLHGTKYYASSGPANLSIGLLMTVNTLTGLTSLVSKCIRWIDLYGYGINSWISDFTCQTVKSGKVSMIARGVCSLRDMEPLMHLETILIGEENISILSDQVNPSMSIVHPDGLRQFQQDNTTLHTSWIATDLLQAHSSEFRYFYWYFESQKWTLLRISGMSCNVLAVQKSCSGLLCKN